MAKNNPLFDAFVIEFKRSAQTISAVDWILQMTLNQKHESLSEGYRLTRMIKTKVKEAMETMSRTQQRNNVIVKYVLVSPEEGEWMLPKGWGSYKGNVYYQCVSDKID